MLLVDPSFVMDVEWWSEVPLPVFDTKLPSLFLTLLVNRRCSGTELTFLLLASLVEAPNPHP